MDMYFRTIDIEWHPLKRHREKFEIIEWKNSIGNFENSFFYGIRDYRSDCARRSGKTILNSVFVSDFYLLLANAITQWNLLFNPHVIFKKYSFFRLIHLFD